MVLYFSGTGNSKFAAEFIADEINDQCVSLNYVLKHNEPPEFASRKPFVICAPIHAGRFPAVVMKLLSKATFSGPRKVYFVATLSSKTCSVAASLKELAKNKHLEFGGLFFVTMPNNYVLGGNVPDHHEAEYQVKYVVVPRLLEVAYVIKNDDIMPEDNANPVVSAVSGSVNVMFNKFTVTSERFVVSDDCYVCGKCVEACPVNNIIIINGDPLFRKRCVNCYACINRCPRKAINIGKRTENFNRYVCPEYKEWKAKGIV